MCDIRLEVSRREGKTLLKSSSERPDGGRASSSTCIKKSFKGRNSLKNFSYRLFEKSSSFFREDSQCKLIKWPKKLPMEVRSTHGFPIVTQ